MFENNSKKTHEDKEKYQVKLFQDLSENEHSDFLFKKKNSESIMKVNISSN